MESLKHVKLIDYNNLGDFRVSKKHENALVYFSSAIARSTSSAAMQPIPAAVTA